MQELPDRMVSVGSLAELIAALRGVGDPCRDAATVTKLLHALLPAWDELAPLARFVRGHYVRTPLYRDPRVEVLLISWSRGASSSVHDHDGQHCWLAPLAGALEIDEWRRVDGSRAPGAARLESLGSRRVRARMLDHRPADGIVHRLRVDDSIAAALSLHVYAGPVDRCLVYDIDNGRCWPSGSARAGETTRRSR